MHRNNLRLVLGLGLVRASSRVRVRVSVLVSVSIRKKLGGELRPISLLPASNLHSSPTHFGIT